MVVIGIIIALAGAVVLLVGLMPAISSTPGPVDIPQVGAGALLILFGAFLIFLARGSSSSREL